MAKINYDIGSKEATSIEPKYKQIWNEINSLKEVLYSLKEIKNMLVHGSHEPDGQKENEAKPETKFTFQVMLLESVNIIQEFKEDIHNEIKYLNDILFS